MQVKKQQLELDMEQQTGSKAGKEYFKAVYCHPAYITYMQSTSWEMPGWMKHKLEWRLLEEITITSDMQMTESEEKCLLIKLKEESEKYGLKLNIQKTKIMGSGPITSWEIDGETVETETDFILGGSKITVAMKLKDAYSLEEKLWKPRQHIQKQRRHFADKGPYSQNYGFSCSHVWMWELDHKEDWALKNWCFQTGVLEKTLESPLDSKEIKPANPKENQPWILV